jgi:o-succinylbenzoate synthase
MGLIELQLSLRTEQLELARPIANAQTRWRRRGGQLVVLTNPTTGARGVGEATPLPGYSPDSESQVHPFLRSLGSSLELPPSPRGLGAAVSALSSRLKDAPPSAVFALQCALLNLWASEAAQPCTVQALDVAPAELIDLDTDWAPRLSVLTEARRSRSSTQVRRTLKLKLGRDWQRELRAVKDLAECPWLELRLDANASLSALQLEELAQSLLHHGLRDRLRFVEEPRPLGALGAPRDLGVPIALDESLWREPKRAQAWLAAGQVTAVVLKPMILGLGSSLAWANRAHRSGALVIVSHLFDGAVAASAYRQLARVLGSPGVAMGLGSHHGEALWAEAARHCPRWPATWTADPALASEAAP